MTKQSVDYWDVDIAYAFSRFYTVVAPRVLRPNSEYHVAITTQETSQPTTVTVEVGGRQHVGGMFAASQTVSVEPYTTRIVKLEVRDTFMCCRFSLSRIMNKVIHLFLTTF